MKPSNFFIPSVARQHMITLPLDKSTIAMKTMKAEKITIGSSIHVLSQLAHAKLLHRKRAEGKISDDEWEFRKRQPMHFFGPINTRPYLPKEWQAKGGHVEAITLGSTYQCSLPIMPLRDDPSKPFMTRERFIHRSKFAKKQMDAHLRHPLLKEFALAVEKRHLDERHKFSMLWQSMQDENTQAVLLEEEAKTSEKGLTGMTLGAGSSFTVANMVSSMTAIDNALPVAYPQNDAAHPIIRVLNFFPMCRPFPGMLYDMTGIVNGCLAFCTFWDHNVYEDQDVINWTDDVAKYVIEYLAPDAEGEAVVQARL